VSGPQRWDWWFRRVLLVIAVERGAELLLSRRNEHRQGPVLGTGGRQSYPLMVLLHLALFWLPVTERRLRPQPITVAVVAPSLIAVAAATGLRLWVIRTLGRNWNVRGRVHADLQVVDGGPYRYMRHPNYVAVALEMAALPLCAPAPLSSLLLSVGNALVLVPRLRGEERLLVQIPGYTEHMGAKPRFLPRVRDLFARPAGR